MSGICLQSGSNALANLYVRVSRDQHLLLPRCSHVESVAERLRRQPAKLMGFARVSSNLTAFETFYASPQGGTEAEGKREGGRAQTTQRLCIHNHHGVVCRWGREGGREARSPNRPEVMYP
jgi:hypothetical protein